MSLNNFYYKFDQLVDPISLLWLMTLFQFLVEEGYGFFYLNCEYECVLNSNCYFEENHSTGMCICGHLHITVVFYSRHIYLQYLLLFSLIYII